jgi:hypothetical protein
VRDVVWTEGPYTIEAVDTEWDYRLEGYMLGHCLGVKDFKEFDSRHQVLSLRDTVGVPHATVLTTYLRTLSEYGLSDDLFGSDPAIYQDKTILHMLQIRGRHDRIARPEYHQIVRRWWKDAGGSYERTDEELDRICRTAYPDTDRTYHYSYLMDATSSIFYDRDFEKELVNAR